MSGAILIVGAGVAGLAAALALRRTGFAVDVFERRAHLTTEGAGIQLGPNATHVLRHLGVADRIAPLASTPASILVHRGHDGRLLTTLPLGADIATRHGSPYWVLHRQDLVRALYEAACDAGAVIRFGEEVLQLSATEDVARLTLANGRIVAGAAVIGADGLWSRVRAQAFDGDAVLPTGLVASRGILNGGREDLRRDAVSVWMAPDAHLVAYPIQGGGALNLVLISPGATRDGTWSSDVTLDEMLLRFRGFPDQARFPAAICALADHAGPWRQWPLVQRPPLVSFAKGRIVLIGDAAHPMLPFLAQGGAMALEDALVLGTLMGNSTDEPAAAFRQFSTLRSSRTQRVVAAAERNGRAYHLARPAAMLRDAALRLLPGAAIMRRYDWLYGGMPAPAPGTDQPNSRT